MIDLDRLAERFGFPKPVPAPAEPPRMVARLSVPLDLSEPALVACPGTTLHNLATCAEHKRARPGIPVPAMTRIDA